jgi:hypothetical protein
MARQFGVDHCSRGCMKSSRFILNRMYVGVALWHGTQSVRPFLMSRRNSGNTANGLMWSTCNSTFRAPQCWQENPSLSSTALRQFLYAWLCRILTLSRVAPPFHRGCSWGGRIKFLSRKDIAESRITIPSAFKRRIVDGRDSPIATPATRADRPLRYNSIINDSSICNLLNGIKPFVNFVVDEHRFPRCATRFFSFAVTECFRPFIQGVRPLFTSLFRIFHDGSLLRFLAAQVWQRRCALSDRTNWLIPQPPQTLITWAYAMYRIVLPQTNAFPA